MSIDAGVSIVVSFLVFALIFAKKIYPQVTKKLDEHIESVRNKISQAETLKDEAYAALKKAHVKKDNTKEIIRLNRLKSEEKIERLRLENEKLLQTLRDRHKIALKNQLEAEFMKQKSQLIEKLSNLIIEKLSEKVISSDCKIDVQLNSDDISRLLSNHER